MPKPQLKSQNLSEILSKLNKTKNNISKNENGRVLIIGGSNLFHGAPILALKTASRIAGMVFFTSSESSIGEVAAELKSKLSSFIWIPWDSVDEYIQKADVVLIGPGMLREHIRNYPPNVKCENLDKQGWETKNITEKLLQKYPKKQWVIDAGSLQVMEKRYIPAKAVLTPNTKEYEMLFGKISDSGLEADVQKQADKYKCTIIYKNNGVTIISDKEKISLPVSVPMSKGGMGDVLAGLVAGLVTKNDPFIAATIAAFINQKAAESLFSKVGEAFNADDLADEVPKIINKYINH